MLGKENVMKRKIFVSLLALIMCFTLGGCAFGTKEKTYISHGLSVTMNDDFKEKSIVSQTVYLESTEAVFSALKEDFSALEAINLGKNASIKEYAEAVVANNNGDYEIKEEDGLTYFEYEKTVSGKDFYYLACVYKSDDAFWLINFASETSNKEKYQPLFKRWAKTVKFE